MKKVATCLALMLLIICMAVPAYANTEYESNMQDTVQPYLDIANYYNELAGEVIFEQVAETDEMYNVIVSENFTVEQFEAIIREAFDEYMENGHSYTVIDAHGDVLLETNDVELFDAVAAATFDADIVKLESDYEQSTTASVAAARTQYAQSSSWTDKYPVWLYLRSDSTNSRYNSVINFGDNTPTSGISHWKCINSGDLSVAKILNNGAQCSVRYILQKVTLGISMPVTESKTINYRPSDTTIIF